jgi:hypothetical protein
LNRIGDERERAQMLSVLAGYVGGEHRGQIIDEVLSAIKRIAEESARAAAIVAIAPRLSPEELVEVVDIADKIDDNINDRVRVFASLAPHLAPVLRELAVQTAFAAAKSFGADVWRVYALLRVAPLLDPKERALAIEEALRTTQYLDKSAAAHALEALGPHLSVDQMERALGLAVRLYGEDRHKAVCGLFGSIVLHKMNLGSHKWRVETEFENSRENYSLVNSLIAVVPRMTDSQQLDVLKFSVELHNLSLRARILVALSAYLSNKVLTIAFDKMLSN